MQNVKLQVKYQKLLNPDCQGQGNFIFIKLARSLLRRRNGCGAKAEAGGEVIVELKSQ